VVRNCEGWSSENYIRDDAIRLFESGVVAVDEISVAVDCDDASFFRRLFKRCTGMTPCHYRCMFQPIFIA
jgi:AraC-like DNA-binding protein